MAEKLPQTYANHVRLHPPFHFYMMPGAILLLVLAIINVTRHYESLEAWILLLIGVLTPIAFLLIRVNALKVQDRVIRLEERPRLAAVLQEPLRSRVGDLRESQVVALRFASDAELPALVEKALNSNMKGGDIKKAIVTWRADNFRV
jgi:hypothetical protein